MRKSISKTQFIAGCRCHKQLWLMQHKPHVCIDGDNTRTSDGDAVGELARKYFADAVTVPLDKAAVMTEKTQALLQEGATTICEATFMANGLSCSTDIVRFYPDGVDVIEVKSSTSAKDIQLSDIAFQCHVIRSAGYNIKNVYLMHINGDYVRGEDINLEELFILENVESSILGRTDFVEENIRKFEAICAGEEPCCDLSCNCEKPYVCPCKEYCFNLHGIPEKSVFSIHGMTAKKKYDLYSAGIVTMEDLKHAKPLLTARQYTQVSELTATPADGELIVVKVDEVKRFLETIRYPLYLLDFETVQHAIPPFPHSRPYAQIPFQYSLHTMTEALATPAHTDFLGQPGVDPRRGLAEKLCRDIPYGEQSMAYNMGFEKSVCNALADLYPDLRAHLLSIVDNMIDLMIPFQKKWVSTPEMHGSYSIKAVLPALCGSDPELDYHALPVVHNGEEAMSAYKALGSETDKNKISAIRNGLLQYCHLDTLAMVKVLNRLYELVEERSVHV